MRAIELAHARGRERWPRVRLELGDFEDYARRKPASALEAHGDELYLACACAAGDRAALQSLEREYFSKVGDYVARTDPSPAFADEVRQQLRARLLVREGEGPPRIGDYSGAGPLGAWLRVAAARTALNLRRGKRPAGELSDEAGALQLRSPAPDPELDYLKSRYGKEFREAFRGVLSGLPARERSLLSLYYLEGLSSPAIGKAFNVHPATVRKWLDSTREEIVRQTHALLKHRLDLSSAELKSLLKVLHSQLEQSVSRFLK